MRSVHNSLISMLLYLASAVTMLALLSALVSASPLPQSIEEGDMADLPPPNVPTSFKLPPHASVSSRKNLIYTGGPVIPTVEIHLLTWGADPSFLTNLESFYNGITSSSWFSIMRQYWTPQSVINHGSFVQTIPLNTTLQGFPTQPTVDDVKDIQPFLKSLVKSGSLHPTANTYFPIHFPAGITVKQGGRTSCSGFCAYHNFVDISDLKVSIDYLYYGVIPDQDGWCKDGCGNDKETVNNLFAISSHELAEAVTNPVVSQGLLAWNNRVEGEIADMCEEHGTTKSERDGQTYVVGTIWSNLDGACVASSSFSP